MPILPSKLARNQFRCFQCRVVHPSRQGDWFDWDGKQVHLCKTCDKLTQDKPERKK